MSDKKVHIQEPGFRSVGMLIFLFMMGLLLFNVLLIVKKDFRQSVVETFASKGTLIISGEMVQGSHLFIDTVEVGSIPFEGEIVTGKHTIRIERETYEHLYYEILIEKDEIATIAVLTKEGEKPKKEADGTVNLVLHSLEQPTPLPTRVPLPTATVVVSVGEVPIEAILVPTRAVLQGSFVDIEF